MKKQKKWYDYLWIVSLLYLTLGFFNIMFAWLGLICFFVPLIISIVSGNKAYCNRYCGRGQLFGILGGKLGLSRKKDVPKFLKSKWFRYGFLAFFMFMFGNMLFSTYLVFNGANVPAWMVQFAFGFYSVMLTSTILGVITMLLYKPRSWCVYCPMGTMTQGICRIKNKSKFNAFK